MGIKTQLYSLSGIICLLILSGCDLVSEQAGDSSEEMHIQFRSTVENRTQQWDDEIIILPDGQAHFSRKSGDHLANSSGNISNDELAYLRKLLIEIDPYRSQIERMSPPHRERQNKIGYSINGESRTLKTGGFVSHRPQKDDIYTRYNELLRELYAYRSSLIADAKHGSSLNFDLYPDITVVSLDEDIPLTYSVQNNTSHLYRLFFANQQQLGLSIYANGEKLKEAPMMRLPATSSWELRPQSTTQRERSWNQTIHYKHAEGYKAKAGEYTIVMYLLDENSPRKATRIRITENGDEPVQPLVMRTNYRPISFSYVLNNRISESQTIHFENEPLATYQIRKTQTGEIIRESTFPLTDDSQLQLDSFEDFVVDIPWDYLDDSGNNVEHGDYIISIYLDEDRLEAEHRFYYLRN